MTNYIALAIPFFFLFIGLEIFVAKRRGVRVYRFSDAVIDLSCGVFQQVTMIFLGGALLALYDALYREHRLYTFADGSPWPWLIAFVVYDFTYYWWHRLSHEVNVLWAAHVVHHSSEDFNLAVALRQTPVTAITDLPFTLPLALLGVPTVPFATIAAFNLLYQFWIHTELVGKLGWFDRFFNSPSGHRVHHAVNPRYLDRNYGGTLMIWDRLFGTYEPETEPCVYGLVKPLGSFNTLWAQVHYFLEMLRLTALSRGAADKLRSFIKGPPWRPASLPQLPPPPEVSPATKQKYDPPLAPGLARYLWFDVPLTMTATFFLLLFQEKLPRSFEAAAASAIVLTLLSWGALIEGRRWATGVALVRDALVAVVGTAALLHASSAALVAAPAVIAGGLAALLLLSVRRAPAMSLS